MKSRDRVRNYVIETMGNSLIVSSTSGRTSAAPGLALWDACDGGQRLVERLNHTEGDRHRPQVRVEEGLMMRRARQKACRSLRTIVMGTEIEIELTHRNRGCVASWDVVLVEVDDPHEFDAPS